MEPKNGAGMRAEEAGRGGGGGNETRRQKRNVILLYQEDGVHREVYAEQIADGFLRGGHGDAKL